MTSLFSAAALKAEWAALKIIFPVLFLSLLNSGGSFVTTLYAGRVGKDHLDGIGLSNTMWSTVVFSFTIGYSTVFDTYGPQVYGSKQKEELSTVALKCIAQGTIIFLFILGPYLNLVYLIDALPDDNDMEGSSSALKEIAIEYLRITAIGAYLAYLIKIMANFLAIQKQTKFVYIIAATSFTSHLILNYVLVERLELGTAGLAAATIGSGSLTTIMAALICFIMIKKGILVWAGISSRIFENWAPMIKLGLSGVVSLIAEIGLFEIATFLSQFNGSVVLSTFIIQFRMITISFAPCLGVSYSAAVLIGKSLSAGDKVGIRLHKKLALFNITVESLVIGVVAYLLRRPLTTIFTDDKDVIEMCTNTYWMLSILIPLDHLQGLLGRGILVPFGKQRFLAISIAIIVSFISLPIVALAIFFTDLQVAGMYIGYLSFCGALSVIFGVRVWKLDLQDEISLTAVRVAESTIKDLRADDKVKKAAGVVNLGYQVDDESLVVTDTKIENFETFKTEPDKMSDVNSKPSDVYPKDVKIILLTFFASVVSCIILAITSLLKT
ncbi:hypothetical protein ACHWQZ_G015491 [Mnemiopsis leidyi]